MRRSGEADASKPFRLPAEAFPHTHAPPVPGCSARLDERTGVHRTPTPTGRVALVACVPTENWCPPDTHAHRTCSASRLCSAPTRPPPGYVHCPRVPRAKDGGHQGGCLLLVSRHARTLCSRPRPVKNNCQCRIGSSIRNCQMTGAVNARHQIRPVTRPQSPVPNQVLRSAPSSQSFTCGCPSAPPPPFAVHPAPEATRRR